MANPRYFVPQSMQVGSTDCYVQWISGAAGAAPTTQATVAYSDALNPQSASPAGIVYTGSAATGYTLNLQEAWIEMMGIDCQIQQATFNSGTGACSGNAEAQNVYGTGGVQPTVTIIFRNAAGTAVALNTGDVVRIVLTLQYRVIQ